jgi:hypothetical protein
MSNGVKIAAIIAAGVVLAALLLSTWQPFGGAYVTLNEVAAIKMSVDR